MRYLTEAVKSDLKKKMVFLSGPRQCGKSTLAKSLLDTNGVYLNWDIRSHQKIIRESSWPKSASLIVLDELHKLPKWKNYLKGLADEFKNAPPLLITGSARLETFRRAGDALTGRFYHYHLHPIDVAESKIFFPRLSPISRAERLSKAGGFPEAFLHPKDSDRLRNDRFDFVLQEDLRDLSKTNSLRQIHILIELLRERVGQKISYKNLAEDLPAASPPTVKLWIELLERLYIIFVVSPYSKGFARGLKKEPKIFFYDSAAAYDPAGRLENMVACSLLKYCDFQRDRFGKDLKLHYFSDREKREVDFIVAQDRKVLWAVEVKSTDTNISQSLFYVKERSKPEVAVQLVNSLKASQERSGIKIEPLANWLDEVK